MRKEKSVPLLSEFHEWLLLKQTEILPSSLLGKAIQYTLNQWDKLHVFKDNPMIPLDNNPAENAIRPFVIGRKNWLFCDTVKGAITNARMYSLIETAKMNGLNPQAYLQSLFEKLPLAVSDETIKALLPQFNKLGQ